MRERVKYDQFLLYLLKFSIATISLFPTLLLAQGCDFTALNIFRFPATIGGKLMVMPDVAIGSVIASTTVPARFDAGPDCFGAGATSLFFSRSDNRGTKDYQQVYPTTIAGLGIRIALRDIKTNLKNIPSIAGVGERFILSQVASTSAFIEGNLQVELIKTAIQIDDRETKEEIFRFSFQNPSGASVSEAKFSLAKVRVVTTGCRVKTKDLLVAMGAIPKDLVSGAKSGYSSTAFNISFECATGTRAFITFSDMSNPNNRTDILSLTKSSTAKGAGIRIFDRDNKAISYGSDSSALGTPGQIPITTSSQGGEVLLPLTARYVSVASGDALKPGIADAITTFTLAYQ
jgi:type 1 fimbria pilin